MPWHGMPLFNIFTQPTPQGHNSRSKLLQHGQCNSKQLTQQINKCNNQTNNAVEVARQSINECRLKIPLQMFIMTLRYIALCASHNMEQPTSAGRHLISCLPDQGARGVTQTILQ